MYPAVFQLPPSSHCLFQGAYDSFFKKFQAQILHLANEVSLMETITSALCRGFFKENVDYLHNGIMGKS